MYSDDSEENSDGYYDGYDDLYDDYFDVTDSEHSDGSSFSDEECEVYEVINPWLGSLSRHDVDYSQYERCSDILAAIRKDREIGQTCDVTIRIEDAEFKVHKTILNFSCKYFQVLFGGSFEEKNQDVIVLQELSKETFSCLVDFLYGANITFTEENLFEIYQCADMYGIESLIEECKEFLKSNWTTLGSREDVSSLIKMMNIDIFQEGKQLLISKEDIEFDRERNKFIKFKEREKCSVVGYPSSEEFRRLKRCKQLMSLIRDGQRNEQFCDAVIQVEDEKFNVHYIVIKATNEYLNGKFSKSPDKRVILDGVSKEVFSFILNFLYGGKFGEDTVSTSNILEDIYKGAKFLCIPALSERCEMYLEEFGEYFGFVRKFGLAEALDNKTMAEDVLDEAAIKLDKFDMSKDKFKDKLKEASIKFTMGLLEKSFFDDDAVNFFLTWVSLANNERLSFLKELITSSKFNFITSTSIVLLETKIEDILQHEDKSEFCNALILKTSSIQAAIRNLVKIRIIAVEDDSTKINVIDFNFSNWQWEKSLIADVAFETEKSILKPGSEEILLIGKLELACYNPLTGIQQLTEMPKQFEHMVCFHEDRVVIGYPTFLEQFKLLRYEERGWNTFNVDLQNNGLNSLWTNCIVSHKDYVLFLAPGQSSSMRDLMVSKYSFASKQHTIVCPLKTCDYMVCVFMVIYRNELFVFTNISLDEPTLVESVDLDSYEKSEHTINFALKRNSTPVAACVVENGIVLAFRDPDCNVLLTLFQPNQCNKPQILGQLPKLPDAIKRFNDEEKTWFYINAAP